MVSQYSWLVACTDGVVGRYADGNCKPRNPGGNAGKSVAYVEHNCWPPISEIPEGSESCDQSRVPLQQYLPDSFFAQAIILEINGLLAVDKTGSSPLEVVGRALKMYSPKKVVKPTLVVRWKSPTEAKTRLCIRCDMWPIRDHVSSPTPFRSALETFLFMAATCHLRIGGIGVIQSSIQANLASSQDQILAGPHNASRYHGREKWNLRLRGLRLVLSGYF